MQRVEWSEAEFETRTGLVWYAMRMRAPKNPGRRSVVVGGKHRVYRDREGALRQRPVPNTGERLSVHEAVLRRAGFEVFEPTKVERRKVSRYSEQKKKVRVPVLPGWLFVGWPEEKKDAWLRLNELGIVSVLGRDGVPMKLKSEQVLDVMVRLHGKRKAKTFERRLSQINWGVGDPARVVGGPFDGFDFEVVGFEAEQVKGFVRIFGRETPLVVAPSALEPVAC